MSNISLGSGPWDQLFGGGNSPAFGVAAVAALASGLIAVLFIPRPGILGSLEIIEKIVFVKKIRAEALL